MTNANCGERGILILPKLHASWALSVLKVSVWGDGKIARAFTDCLLAVILLWSRQQRSEFLKEIQIDNGMREYTSRSETAAIAQRTIDRSIGIPISSVSWRALMLLNEIDRET